MTWVATRPPCGSRSACPAPTTWPDCGLPRRAGRAGGGGLGGGGAGRGPRHPGRAHGRPPGAAGRSTSWPGEARPMISVAVSPPQGLLRSGLDARRALLGAIADAGLDGLLYADHVSFRGGSGMEALVLMAGLSQLHPDLQLNVGVYLLPLRHPVPVARAIATVAELAPGRLVFGVGIGGEDRHEVEVCGVDPRTRGRRCDECLPGTAAAVGRRVGDLPRRVLRRRGLSGAARARARRCRCWSGAGRTPPCAAPAASATAGWPRGCRPAGWPRPRPAAPRWRRPKVGARSTGSTRCRPGSASTGHPSGPGTTSRRGWRTSTASPSTGSSATRRRARPEQVAEFLAPYRDLGVRRFNLTPCAASAAEAIELTGEVKRLLNA